MTKVSLKLKVEGPSLKEGIPIGTLVQTLQSVQRIAEQSYLSFTDRKKMSREDRAALVIRTDGVRSGSLESNIDLIFAASQPLMPFMLSAGAIEIWRRAEGAWGLAKKLYRAVSSGKNPVTHIEVKDQGRLQLTVNNNTILCTRGDLEAMKRLVPHFRDLTHLMEPGRVDGLTLRHDELPGIAVGSDDKGLFDEEIELKEELHRLLCRIFDFNTYDKSGKAEVEPGQDITEGKYRFTLVGSQKVDAYIEALHGSRVRLNCLYETVSDPGSEEPRVVNLQVVGIEPETSFEGTAP